MLQCVAVCCSASQCVAVCSRVLQYVLQAVVECDQVSGIICCRLLQCVLQCMLQHVLPLFKSSVLRAVRVAGCGARCVNGEYL